MSSLLKDRPARPRAANAARLYEAGELEFTAVFQHAPIGMSLIALDMRRLRVNAALCRMVGYTQEELLQGSLHEITHADELEADLREREALLAGEKDAYGREKRYLHRDGRVLWAHVNCSLVRDTAGRPLYFVSQVQDITERRHAEQALRESEERFRSLTALSADWYWEQDENLRFAPVTRNYLPSAWGEPVPNVPGKTRWELDGALPVHGTWEEHRAVLLARRPFRDFHYTLAHGGRVRHICASGEPVHDAEGRFRGYRGVARDVTDSKLAERKLQAAQALLQMAAQVGRLGAWSWDVGDERVLWSDQVCAIHDVRPGFAPRVDQALSFFAPAHRESVRALIKGCVRHGRPFETEAQVVTSKGRRVWTRIICEAELDSAGRVRRIQGAAQDISESKRAAEQNRLMAQQLTTTLESLTDAFVTVDRDFCFTYLNAQAERLVRRSRMELLGRNLLDVLPDLRGSDVQRHLERAQRENCAVEYEREYAPLGIWVHVKVYPSRQGLAMYVKDVTESVAAKREIMRLNAELEERVRHRTAQLEAANKELEAFSYSIAHDLRAPLSSIDGFSQMLDEAAGDGLAPRCRHFIGRIRAGVRQMAELTDGLLSLANFSRANLRWEQVDLAVLARTTLASLRERSPQRAVEALVAPTLPVQGDPRLLAQVIGNLVGNAWKFTACSAKAHIAVGCEEGPQGPIYFVKDNGAGFDMRHASRMFEAFQRMHTAAEFEGTGIGLAIVHKIVTRHGGRIWAHSAPGEGAAFYFVLGDAPA